MKLGKSKIGCTDFDIYELKEIYIRNTGNKAIPDFTDAFFKMQFKGVILVR
jgi:hypothetical protein